MDMDTPYQDDGQDEKRIKCHRCREKIVIGITGKIMFQHAYCKDCIEDYRHDQEKE